MKKVFIIVFVLIIVFASVYYYQVVTEKKNTKEYVMKYIEQKGVHNITWKDFEYLPHSDIGSGLNVYRYQLEDGVLIISGSYRSGIVFNVSIESGDERIRLSKYSKEKLLEMDDDELYELFIRHGLMSDLKATEKTAKEFKTAFKYMLENKEEVGSSWKKEDIKEVYELLIK